MQNKDFDIHQLLPDNYVTNKNVPPIVAYNIKVCLLCRLGLVAILLDASYCTNTPKWFPVLVECDHQTKMIQCTCKSTSNARERADYEFNPVYIHSRYLVRDFNLWKFPTDHRLYKTFPIDPELKNYVRQVPQTVFSITQSIPFKTGSKLAVTSTKALTDILDLSPQVADSPDFVKFVSGDLRSGSCSDIQKDEIHSTCPTTTEPETVNPSCVGPLCRVIALSHRYGGHQFGQWAGQLGDGRAVMLGEYVNSQGERWELQLKGSGLTPYSRRGDGRAVIRSSVREFLCSEAMYHLGIPTSRAASLAISNDTVIRDQFYDGHPQRERTAVVLRLARSWFRIGSLEILAYSGEHELLQQLVDFVIAEYFPDISVKDTGKYLVFFQEVVRDTASLIARWQSVGFTHGVCNTDNFSLLSVTIDYGPFGFLDEYDPSFVPNTSDDESRYSYEKQPDVGAYNLEKLRLALEPLWSEAEKIISKKILMSYGDHYKQKFMEIFRQKLGLETNGGDDDQNLVAVLLKIMSDTKADFTMTFRDLSEMSLSDLQSGNIQKQFWALRTATRHDWFQGWVRLYAKRLSAERQSDARRRYIMEKTNPRYVLRNWIAQLAVDRTQDNDFSVIHKIHRILQNPFRYQEEAESMRLASKPPQWAKQLKVSCSS